MKSLFTKVLNWFDKHDWKVFIGLAALFFLTGDRTLGAIHVMLSVVTYPWNTK